MRINLCCDIGEGWGAYRIADDAALLRIVSSANVACGFHAGDPSIMVETVARCKELGVAVGAHLGKPDLYGFGRRDIPLTDDEIFSAVLYQSGALHFIAQVAEWPMRYVSHHGNLGATISKLPELSHRIIRAWSQLSPKPAVQGMPGDKLLGLAAKHGLIPNTVFLSDRGYHSDGRLVARGSPGALLDGPIAVRSRIRQLVTFGYIESVEGQKLPMNVDTIVIHSDTPGSLEMARQVRSELDELGVQVSHPFED